MTKPAHAPSLATSDLAARIARIDRLVAQLQRVRDESAECRELVTQIANEIAAVRADLKPHGGPARKRR